MPEQPLKGQVALVTGGAKRIGRSIVERLAADGADVIVNYQTSSKEAEAVVTSLKAGGRRSIALKANVSKSVEVRAMFEAVENEFGKLNILVNNAAIFLDTKFESITEEDWDRIIDTNLKGTFLCSQAAAPLLRNSGGGNIVNLSSLGGFLPWPSHAHYCTSKAGVVMLTKCMARALAPDIRVNSVAPGTIQFEGETPDEVYIKRAPLHRTGTGEDIAGAVAYFLSAPFVTGQIIAVDGGRILT